MWSIPSSGCSTKRPDPARGPFSEFLDPDGIKAVDATTVTFHHQEAVSNFPC